MGHSKRRGNSYEIPHCSCCRERERERERVNSSGSFPHRHKLLFGLIVIVGVLLYAAFNVWVYQTSKNGKGLSPATLWQAVSTSGTGFQGLTGLNPVKKQGSNLPENGSKPTPRPTGPGEYACSPAGDCNLYGDEARKAYCTQTYADSSCLDQCGDTTKLCTK